MTRFTFAIAITLLTFTALANGQQHSGEQLCAKVKMIKQLPHERVEKGVDTTFDDLVAAGDSIVPCLIDNITDQTIMDDPRCPGISTATTIGDVSYFVLVRIMNLDFKEFLPEDFQMKYKTQGVYAYHEYIDKKGSRKELQHKLRKWYSANKGK